MKMILFNQNPMITKLLESVSKKLELPMENFNHYQELSTRLKEEPEWILIADDECLEKLDQVDWLELKETISQNKNSVCMYKKGNEAQPFLEGFEMKIQKPFLPTEILKILQKKLGSNMSELEPSQNLDPTQEVLETNWDELENLGDLEALAKEEPNNEEQLLPTLNDQEEKEEIKKEEKEEKEEVKEEIKETPKEEEKPKEETQEGETLKDEEVSKGLETQEEVKEETQEEPIKEETQEIKEEKQEETQDSPSAQELEAMQELVKEIQENSNGDKEETQENAEIPQDKEIQEVVTEKTQVQELEVPKEKTQESTESLQETQAHELEKQEIAETPQDVEIPQSQEKETPQEKTQETQEKETPQTQDEKPQEDHYESIEDIPEPVMAKAMGEELPFLNESVAKTPNNENDTETPKKSITETSKNENATEAPQEKEESDKISSPLELRLNLQDLLKSLNQESLKSLLENKTLSIKITLEDKKPNA
ncbi:chemotaxis regulatory protein ChePep [Helicobacter pylori]|uniref:chemotaxis regulatory protein ChePep n=1 Tax=Helicobacter pylori TaxID=210 RepID=UPI002575AAC1|nr:chemotaxis regulatory protein ChePep [Helicobacter pylori]WJI99399.1 chemotaxis regulatory protein ChePep [Helicobacter pylori]WJJ05942.1 chemotaxis regulatory protein ChePep [Helicobacter pylori]